MCLIEELNKTAGASSKVSCCPQDRVLWTFNMKKNDELPCM